MAQTTLSVRMDDSLKSDFDKVCNELGLSMTTAITMLAKKMTREKRLPFEVSVDPFYSEENLARLRRSIAQMESTGGTVHEEMCIRDSPEISPEIEEETWSIRFSPLCILSRTWTASERDSSEILFCQHEKTSWYLEDENILSAKEMVEYTSTEELTP